MRRLLIIFLCVAVVFDIIAQQDPQYSHYMFNNMAVNPGYAGSQEAICLTAVHRQQWVGFPGAPVTSVFTVHTPFRLFGAEHGFGLKVMNDKLGFDQNVSVKLNYAYKLPLGPGKLGIGVSGMFLNKALNAEWKPPGGGSWEQDPSIPAPNESVTGYDMGLGIFYRAERVYMGVSTTHLLQSGLPYANPGSNYRLIRHYYATAGAVLPLLGNPAWEVAPSVMAYSDGTVTHFSGNVNVIYNGKVWGGMGYRISSIVAMVGFDLFNGVKIGYAFDYTHTSMKNHFSAGGSHELMINYCFNLVKERVVKGYRSVRYL